MKQILLTCDTEVGELAQGFDEAFDIFVLGKITGEQVGVPLINSIAAWGGGQSFCGCLSSLLREEFYRAV